MSLPLHVILKKIEEAPGSLTPILSSLHYDTSILKNISNPDRNHLVGRSLKLARSNDAYQAWCGVNLLYVICSDYQVLASNGVAILGQIIKLIERSAGQLGKKPLFISSIQALNKICDTIRGKPTLTREIMTPKLPTIITLLYENIDVDTVLTLESLQKLIKFHPTTFRPFGNKLKAKLLEILRRPHILSSPLDLKALVYKTLALLPAIEKVDPEIKWQDNVFLVIKEASMVLSIYQSFLNFQDDAELSKRLKLLTHLTTSTSDLVYDKPLKVEMDTPSSLLLVSDRFAVLLELLLKLVETETNFPVNVPLGQVLALVDVACSINTRFLSFKRDVYDPELRNMVKTSINFCQGSACSILLALPSVYGKSVSSHLKNTLSLLEATLPFSNRKLDIEAVKTGEPLMRQVLSTATSWMYLSLSIDPTHVIRFIEVAMLLVKPSNPVSIGGDKNSKSQTSANGSKQKNKKKNTNAASMSDLLSHTSLFVIEASELTEKVVRSFLLEVIKRVKIPHTQRYKITRYIIVEAVKAQKNRTAVPKELKKLLIASVLYPGPEATSILPFVCNILPEEEVISLFNNPRFPPLPKFVKTDDVEPLAYELEEEDEGEEILVESATNESTKLENVPEEKTNIFKRSAEEESNGNKKQKIEPEIAEEVLVQQTIVEPAVAAAEIKQEEVIGNKTNDAPIEVDIVRAPSPSQTAPISTTLEVNTTFNATNVTEAVSEVVEEAAEDSDFEMPEIDVGDDEDDE